MDPAKTRSFSVARLARRRQRWRWGRLGLSRTTPKKACASTGVASRSPLPAEPPLLSSRRVVLSGCVCMGTTLQSLREDENGKGGWGVALFSLFTVTLHCYSLHTTLQRLITEMPHVGRGGSEERNGVCGEDERQRRKKKKKKRREKRKQKEHARRRTTRRRLFGTTPLSLVPLPVLMLWLDSFTACRPRLNKHATGTGKARDTRPPTPCVEKHRQTGPALSFFPLGRPACPVSPSRSSALLRSPEPSCSSAQPTASHTCFGRSGDGRALHAGMRQALRDAGRAFFFLHAYLFFVLSVTCEKRQDNSNGRAGEGKRDAQTRREPKKSAADAIVRLVDDGEEKREAGRETTMARRQACAPSGKEAFETSERLRCGQTNETTRRCEDRRRKKQHASSRDRPRAPVQPAHGNEKDDRQHRLLLVWSSPSSPTPFWSTSRPIPPRKKRTKKKKQGG